MLKTSYLNIKPCVFLFQDVYAHRKLPSFIGTPGFQKDDLVGLGESSSEGNMNISVCIHKKVCFLFILLKHKSPFLNSS